MGMGEVRHEGVGRGDSRFRLEIRRYWVRMGNGGRPRLAGSWVCGPEKHFHRGVPAAKVFSRDAVEILLDGRGSENDGAGGLELPRREPAVEKRGGFRSGAPPPGPRLPIASRRWGPRPRVVSGELEPAHAEHFYRIPPFVEV